MNYIELINFFWTANEEHSFRTTDIALYFYLLKVNNDCSWKESFKRNNRKVEVDLCISFNTLKDSRNRLKNANLINFKTVNGDANVLYTIINTSSNFDEVTNEVRHEVTYEVSTRSVPSKDKLNKTKEENITIATVVAKTPKPEVDISIRKNKFYEDCAKYVEKYGKEMVRDFFDYWTETNKSGKKMRFEDQKFFDMSKRFATWNNKSFNHGKTKQNATNTSTANKDFRSAIADGLARGLQERSEHLQ